MQQFDTTSHRDSWQVLGGTGRSQAAVMTLPPGNKTGGSDNKHITSDQWLYVISGRGLATVSGRDVTLKAGTLLLIEAGETHEIRNPGDDLLATVNFYAPPEY